MKEERHVKYWNQVKYYVNSIYIMKNGKRDIKCKI